MDKRQLPRPESEMSTTTPESSAAGFNCQGSFTFTDIKMTYSISRCQFFHPLCKWFRFPAVNRCTVLLSPTCTFLAAILNFPVHHVARTWINEELLSHNSRYCSVEFGCSIGLLHYFISIYPFLGLCKATPSRGVAR